MKLYGYFRSSASYRIRIILNLKDLDHDSIAVMLNLGEQHEDEFKSINPMGFVPVLDVAGALLAQSPAIAEYLEEQYPDRPLLPSETVARARVREMMHTIGCDIHPLQNLRVLKHLRAEFSQDDEGVRSWCQKWRRLRSMLGDHGGDSPGLDVPVTPAFCKKSRERWRDHAPNYGESCSAWAGGVLHGPSGSPSPGTVDWV